MLSPAFSFAWLLWRRHGRGLLVVLGYLLFASVLSAVVPRHMPDNDFKGAAFVMVFGPPFLLPFYAMVIFAYGQDVQDVASGKSCFPAGLFQLPVRTGALTAWPLAFGTAATVLLWVILAYFVLDPWLSLPPRGSRPGFQVPLWWPGMLAAAGLACFQAVLWFPFGIPWLRVYFLAAMLPAVFMLTAFGVTSRTPEIALVAMFAGIAATAWTIAYVGVRRARCGGGVMSWEWLLRPFRQFARMLPQRRTPFALAAQAQQWYEWRLSRFAQPIFVAMGLPLVLWLFFADQRAFHDDSQIRAPLAWSLAVPVIAAGIGADWLRSGRSRSVQNPHGMTPFAATLPMSSAAMVGALLRATVWSTLGAWTVVVMMVPSVVVLSGHFDGVIAFLQTKWHGLSPGQIAVRTIAIAAMLLVWTWKRKVYRLCLGLTGRKWLEMTLGWGRLPAYFLLCFVWFFWIPKWIRDEHISDETVLAVLPWLIGLYMLCRLAATAWALRQSVRRGLLEARTAKRWVAGWLLVAAALFAVVAWAAPDGMPMFYRTMPMYYCAAAVLFVMPMTRLAAMPLALAWNRHR